MDSSSIIPHMVLGLHQLYRKVNLSKEFWHELGLGFGNELLENLSGHCFHGSNSSFFILSSIYQEKSCCLILKANEQV